MKDDAFQEVLERFDRRKKPGGGQISVETASRYRSKAHDFRAWIDQPIEDVDFVTVEDWYAELDEQYQSSAPVSKAKGALSAFFDIANDLAKANRIDIDGWGRETPADRARYAPNSTAPIKQRKTRETLQYLKPKQVDELARSAEKHRDELIIKLLFQTGLRVSELCEIRVSDVNREARSIQVRGKGRKNRPVYYQPTLDLLMDVWMTEKRPAVFYAEESDYLFPTSHSEKITKQTVAEVVRESAEEAGLQEVYGTNTDGVELHSITPHVLRHSFAMTALDEGWDIYTLSHALGHESTQTTAETYLHDDEKRVREAYRTRGPSTVSE